MKHFTLSNTPFDTATLRAELLDDRVGGFASFEGWVRDHNADRAVLGLRYEAPGLRLDPPQLAAVVDQQAAAGLRRGAEPELRRRHQGCRSSL